MLEKVAIRPAVEAFSEEKIGSVSASRFLSGDVVRQGPVWASSDAVTDSANWNDLANENEIHAAISTFNERKEEMKSRENLRFILAHTEPDTVVLDLGCGYGRLAKYLLPVRRFEAYIGLDCSPVMLKKFHERYADVEAERGTPLTLVRADIDRIPLLDASVDTCIVSAVYLHNHKEVTRRSIAEIRRVLKPGGRVLVISSFPNALSLTGVQGWAFLTYLKLRGESRKNGPVRYFAPGEIKAMFEGFSEVELHPFGFSMLPKTVLGMPLSWRRPYRLTYDRIHAFLARVLPAAVRNRFCSHFDVVARV